MPFTAPLDRKKMEEFVTTGVLPEKVMPGDWCYLYYKDMVERWKKERRWTTAHNIYKEMRRRCQSLGFPEEEQLAYELAWQVFFQLHVMPYEEEKRKENGDI